MWPWVAAVQMIRVSDQLLNVNWTTSDDNENEFIKAGAGKLESKNEPLSPTSIDDVIGEIAPILSEMLVVIASSGKGTIVHEMNDEGLFFKYHNLLKECALRFLPLNNSLSAFPNLLSLQKREAGVVLDDKILRIVNVTQFLKYAESHNLIKLVKSLKSIELSAEAIAALDSKGTEFVQRRIRIK